MTAPNTPRSSLPWQHTAVWLMRHLSRPFRRSAGTRFLQLTPPPLRRQLVYDRATGSLLRLRARDATDAGTLGQIFGDDNYRLDRLRRYDELVGRYRAIRAAGDTPLIIDCGANAGFSTLYFARTFPEAHVVAIEPDVGNLASARFNCRGQTNVSFIEAGVSSTPGRGALVDPGNGNNAYRTVRAAAGALRLVSIGEVLADAPSRGWMPFVAKIDIEGFETDLFSANVEWVDQFPLLVIELHDWLFPRSATSANFLKCIAARDRDFIHLGENVFSIRND